MYIYVRMSSDLSSRAPHVTETLGLTPRNLRSYLLIFIMYSVYHKHKRDWDAGCYDDHILSLECEGSGQNEIKHLSVDFPQTAKRSVCGAALAYADKLEILLCSHARNRRASAAWRE